MLAKLLADLLPQGGTFKITVERVEFSISRTGDAGAGDADAVPAIAAPVPPAIADAAAPLAASQQAIAPAISPSAAPAPAARKQPVRRQSEFDGPSTRDRVFSVLAEHPAGLHVQQIADKAGTSRANVYAIAAKGAKDGELERVGNGVYKPASVVATAAVPAAAPVVAAPPDPLTQEA